jgi:23S rRNA (cytidine1920-2'-O)/16S rRNA (cytidine1409-2'-O)-methyltransferase
MATVLPVSATSPNISSCGGPDTLPTVKSKPLSRRLDVLLVERGLAETTVKAQAMILAGEVFLEGQRAEKAGTGVAETSRIDVHSRSQKYASRGGIKLEGALADFSVDPSGRTCLDAGSSTGGFTDCLLQNGATRVYAVDVNIAQLDWKLRQDPRVICIQRNVRELRREDTPEPIDLVVADLSFISVARVLIAISSVARAAADLLILVKPQFELPKQDVGRGGIVVDPLLHGKAVASVTAAAEKAGLDVLGSRPSRLPGAEGNLEYFLHARKKTLE